MTNLHHHQILHEVRLMINSQQFTNMDMDIVCSNGVLKQNKALLFLECYGNIFESRAALLAGPKKYGEHGSGAPRKVRPKEES